MYKIGLTGGIGSGKSLAAQLFQAHQIPVIDADHIAQTLTQPQTPCFQKIIQHFGETFILPNGTLDRKKLRNTIFEDPQQKKWLEDLLHPLIKAQITKAVHRLSNPYCIIEISLLLESNWIDFVDQILVIECDPVIRIKRLLTRDAMPKETIEKIIQTQATSLERQAKADHIIYNEGSKAQFKQAIEQWIANYTPRFE